jgi:hypothetical protein
MAVNLIRHFAYKVHETKKVLYVRMSSTYVFLSGHLFTNFDNL